MGIQAMRELEESGLERKGVARTDAEKAAVGRVIGLFVLVILGVLAAWFWDVGSAYLGSDDPNKVPQWGTLTELAVRFGLALIVACLTFPTIYEKIGKSTGDSWIAYFLAFQNGFFWQAVFEGVKEGVVA